MVWFDRSGLIYGMLWNTGDALNGILHLAYYIHVKKETVGENDHRLIDAYNYCFRVKSEGNFSSGIEKTYKEDRASHDDMTAILSIFNRNVIGEVKTLPYIYRPAEFIHYSIWNGSKIAKLFTPILSIKLIYSCLRDYNAGNGIYETDGKLLAWLILNTSKMPLTEKICFKILTRKFGPAWLKELFKIKFPWTDHPVRIALEGN